MKILIFGGTTEGRNLSLALASEGADVTVSVVSELGAEELNQYIPGDTGCANENSGGTNRFDYPSGGRLNIVHGPKDVDDICSMLQSVGLCVDATHPYAVLVTENIRQAAGREGVELLRVMRAKSDLDECVTCPADDSNGTPDPVACMSSDSSGIIIAADPADAAAKAKTAGGRVLLTTGSKDLQTYADILDPELLYARVLPMSQSITACEKAGIPHRNIIAIQGPFSEELNSAIINEYNISVLITKDSGKAGGFEEKLRACRQCGIPAIVITRPEEKGLSYDEVLAICRERLFSEQ